MTALSVEIPSGLSVTERARLDVLESKIESGIKTFVEVGCALMEVRDSTPPLYRETHRTFEGYCRDRWGMSRIHAHRLIEAADVSLNLLPVGNTPTSERHLRPLTHLEPEQQREAWRVAVETAPEGKITAAHVENVVLEMEGKSPHVANNSGNNEWYTPAPFIEAARLAMGTIDTDPASSEIANRTVQAAQYFDAEANGLRQRWCGSVWMNPPYSQPLISEFCEAVVAKFLSGEIEQACVLVNNATETAWFQCLQRGATAVCFPRSRIRYNDSTGLRPGSPLQGQAVVYLGHRKAAFSAAFAELGWVLFAGVPHG